MAGAQITYVALLRGINVGGHTTISMAGLKTCFEELDYDHVKTYINSGNVIFRTTIPDPRALETTIEKALTATFGHQVTVVVRSFSDMKKLLRQIPDSWQTASDQKCNVIFLRHAIDNPKALKDLQPKPGIEELHYHPGVLFWSAQTSNLSKSNMLKVSQSPLYKQMTIRNLTTTRKIYELMQSR